MSTITVSCPQARRTKNRRKNKSSIYQSASWKRAKAEFVKGKKCELCGSTESLLPHHPWKNTPDNAYEDLYLSECVVLCNTCHFMLERRHKVICPVCHENYMPIDPNVDRCWLCHLKQHPEKAKAIKENQDNRESKRKQINKDRAEKRRNNKVKHPCKKYLISGCCKGSMIGSKCPYGIRTAKLKCGDFEEKKGVKT